jgi:nucleotide-binding universal stress UspA family protein
VFKQILVPVDLSDRHQQALEVAARLARDSDGEVTLLHVIDIVPGPWLQERDFYKRIAQLARAHPASHRPQGSQCRLGNCEP